jgi:hypothetical protein
MIHFQDIRSRAIRVTDERLHYMEIDYPEMAGQLAWQKHRSPLTGLFAHEQM